MRLKGLEQGGFTVFGAAGLAVVAALAGVYALPLAAAAQSVMRNGQCDRAHRRTSQRTRLEQSASATAKRARAHGSRSRAAKRQAPGDQHSGRGTVPDAQTANPAQQVESLPASPDTPAGAEIQADGSDSAGRTPEAVEPTLEQVSTPIAPTPAPPVTELPPRPTLQAVRTKHAPTIDGVIEDAEWRDAVPIVSFTQKAPFSGRVPTDKTTMRLIYDDDALYVAFDCEQASSPVVARLARRDRPSETDSVSVAFDSRADGRSAFEFSVSAAGVLVDGLRFDDSKISREWDGIWEAKTEVRGDSWSAELRIPLHVLRFATGAESAWKFQARRYISARQETDEWAYIPRDVGGEVSHYGRIEGLRGLGSSGSLELQPFILGRAGYQTPDPAIVSSGWTLRPSAGLDFKWHPADNFALDGTINPDFGQVEADRLILNLTTVELVFPEKRPFFLAGMDDFVTMTPIFYSRRIGRTPQAPRLSSDPRNTERLYDYAQAAPIYGALKLAGDLRGGWTVAALSAVTGPNEVDVVLPSGARQPRLLDPLTSYNVLRVRTELAPGLDIGVTGTATLRNEPGFGWPAWLTSSAQYSAAGGGINAAAPGGAPVTQRCPLGEIAPIDERCFHDAYVGSVDLVWRSPSGDYALRAQGYGSAIEGGPLRTLPDGTAIGAGDLGTGGTVRLSKQGGEHWLLDGTIAVQSRRLDFNDLGFMDRQNYVRGGAYVEYRTLEPWWALMETHTSAMAYAANNLDGLALGRGLVLMEDLVLDSRWTLSLAPYVAAPHFDDREVGDGTALERAALLGAVQAVSTDPRRSFVVSAQLAEERLENGTNFNAQLGITWQPLATAELQILSNYTYNFGEPRYAGTGQSASDLVFGRLEAQSVGVTLRASYTFVPTLTLQTYAQTFLAAGQYFDYAHFTAPIAGPRPIVRLSELVPGDAPAIRPDFERASLAVNVVLRWEYHLGSMLYLLYVRSQSPNVALDPVQAPRLDLNVIRNGSATDVFMIKLAYWLG
jgi:hypothetical protein